MPLLKYLKVHEQCVISHLWRCYSCVRLWLVSLGHIICMELLHHMACMVKTTLEEVLNFTWIESFVGWVKTQVNSRN
jgi:hypothetical protein